MSLTMSIVSHNKRRRTRKESHEPDIGEFVQTLLTFFAHQHLDHDTIATSVRQMIHDYPFRTTVAVIQSLGFALRYSFYADNTHRLASVTTTQFVIVVFILEYISYYSEPGILVNLISCIVQKSARSLRLHIMQSGYITKKQILQPLINQTTMVLDCVLRPSTLLECHQDFCGSISTHTASHKVRSALLFLRFVYICAKYGNVSVDVKSQVMREMPANVLYNHFVDHLITLPSSRFSCLLWSNQFMFTLDTRTRIIRSYFRDMMKSCQTVMRQQQQQQQQQQIHSQISSPDEIIVKVDRLNIMDSILQALRRERLTIFLPIKVRFVGPNENEETIDEGGIRTEAFRLFFESVVSPSKGLFTFHHEAGVYLPIPPSSPSSPALHPSGDVGCNDFDNNVSTQLFLQTFFLIGRAIGMCFYHNMQVVMPLAPHIFSFLTANQVDNLKEFSRLYPNMEKVLRDVESMQCQEYFDDAFPGGISVQRTHHDVKHMHTTIENITIDPPAQWSSRSEYSNHVRMCHVLPEFNPSVVALAKGVWSVIDNRILNTIYPDELRLFCCGALEISVEKLRAHAVYEGFHVEDDDTDCKFIDLLWEVLHEFDTEHMRKFLIFVSSSPTISADPSFTITIQNAGEYENGRLPTAHTCFNTLILPKYKTKNELKTLLLISISHAEGFGLL